MKHTAGNFSALYYYHLLRIGTRTRRLLYGIQTERGNLHCRAEMHQIAGHAYFEEYAKALPSLEAYATKRPLKAQEKTLYELSYSYYQDRQLEQGHRWF